MATIRTTYEVRKPQEQFYSTQKMGFENVQDLLVNVIDNIRSQGAMTLVNVAVYDSTTTNIGAANTQTFITSVFPPTERIFELVNPGVGYRVNDEITVDTPAGSSVRFVVNTVSGTGAITKFFMIANDQTLSANSAFQSNFVANVTYISGTTRKDNRDSRQMTVGTGLTASDGNISYSQLATIYIKVPTNWQAATAEDPGLWPDALNNAYIGQGADNTAVKATTAGAIYAAYPPGGRLPTSGVWFANTTTGGTHLILANIRVGDEVTLDTTRSNAPTSVIPPKTRVVEKRSVRLYNTVIPTFISSGNVKLEESKTESGGSVNSPEYFQLVFDKPVTISKDDWIAFRGAGATFKNTLQASRPFRAVLESNGATDPLADQIGVLANLYQTTAESNVALVGNLSVPGNPWTPKIYAGQTITSVNLGSSTITSPLTVTSVEPFVQTAGNFVTGREYTVKTTGNTDFTAVGASSSTVGTVFIATGAGTGNGTAIDSTISRLNLDRNHSFSIANERLQFRFGETQAWRLMFDARPNFDFPTVGSQSLIMYAGTELQLPNDCAYTNIVSNSRIIDQAGLMGDRPYANIANISINVTVGGATIRSPNLAIISNITALNNAVGSVGSRIPTTATNLNTSSIFDSTDPTQGFMNRASRVQNNPAAYPLNYMLTLTNRGIFFGIWEGNWSVVQKTRSRMMGDRDSYFNWFVVQRPVNRVTGQILTTGNAPVFCINSVGYKYWKFIVRESDVLHPTQGPQICQTYEFSSVANVRSNISSVTTSTGTTTFSNVITTLGNAAGGVVTNVYNYRTPADVHSTDSFAIINSQEQLSLTEDSKYLISFLTNLTTPRFRYSEELDMIGQTSADVCGAGLDVSINAYQESGPRKYRALPSSGPYNSGMRICVLKDVP